MFDEALLDSSISDDCRSEAAHLFPTQKYGIPALKLVDHEGSPAIPQEVEVGIPSPIYGHVLDSEEAAHKEQKRPNICRQ